MRVAVFGATGMAGSAIVSEALRRGHRVIAASRHPCSTASGDDRLIVHAVDLSHPDEAGPLLADSDAAILTIRLVPGQDHRLAPMTQGFLDVAARHCRPVIIIGGAAPLRLPNHPDRLLIDDPAYVPQAWKTIARASLEQYRVCQLHPYSGWVYLSPPAVFESGERSGRYRRGTTTLLTDAQGISRISAPDLAIAVLDELERPSGDRHITVCQESAPEDARS